MWRWAVAVESPLFTSGIGANPRRSHTHPRHFALSRETVRGRRAARVLQLWRRHAEEAAQHVRVKRLGRHEERGRRHGARQRDEHFAVRGAAEEPLPVLVRRVAALLV